MPRILDTSNANPISIGSSIHSTEYDGYDNIWDRMFDDWVWGDALMQGGDGSESTRAGIPGNIYRDTLGTDGNDTIFGGDKDDVFDGGKGLDAIYGGGGNDEISGGPDTDWLFGEDDQDNLFGGDGADQLYGGPGLDRLHGNEGNDWLDGESGDDFLSGGGDGDWLTGGSGFDTFSYIFAGSESSVDHPDQIMDFSTADDVIDLPVSPLPSDYTEDTIGYGKGYDAAKIKAVSLVNDSLLTDSYTYAFVTDGVNGYLFADFEENGTIDTGIILVGLTSLSDFDFTDII